MFALMASAVAQVIEGGGAIVSSEYSRSILTCTKSSVPNLERFHRVGLILKIPTNVPSFERFYQILWSTPNLEDLNFLEIYRVVLIEKGSIE
ncbi:hypothetical protein CEXT_283191 [Caerostris extrusa]|uniref:Uncharacterized protein n=1 Tax=Caerostris extrusa TaxID=172846 RepID=A0AAV4UUX5_CAEEX|nr:hypothetical protein CEXT_283191 [Caerostris extrusa]